MAIQGCGWLGAYLGIAAQSNSFYESTGIEFTSPNSLTMNGQALFNTSRSYPWFNTDNSSLVAEFLSEGAQQYPAITLNQYGRGKAIYAGFDLVAEIASSNLGEVEQSQFVDILKNSLQMTKPIFDDNAFNSVQLNVNNLGASVSTLIEIIWPPQSGLLGALPSANIINSTHQWDFNFANSQSQQFSSWAIPYFANDSEKVTANIYLNAASNSEPYESYEVTLTPQNPLQNLRTLRDELSSLTAQLPSYQHSKVWSAKDRLEKAIYANDRQNYDRAVIYLLESTDFMQSIDNSAAISLRLQLDRHIYNLSAKVEQ